MSYPAQPEPPAAAPIRRPAAVAAAAALMSVMAVAGVAYPILGLATMPGLVRRFRDAAAGTDAGRSDIDGLIALVWTAVILAAVIGLVVAVLLIVLAVGNLRGRNGARIATWVVCALGVISGCCGVGAVLGQRLIPLKPTDGREAELLGALGEAYPSWLIGLSGGLSAAQVFGYLVVALLLALPAANAFFHRRPPSQWQPPVPPAAPPPPM